MFSLDPDRGEARSLINTALQNGRAVLGMCEFQPQWPSPVSAQSELGVPAVGKRVQVYKLLIALSCANPSALLPLGVFCRAASAFSLGLSTASSPSGGPQV